MNYRSLSNSADDLSSRALSLLEELDPTEKLKVLEYLQVIATDKDNKNE